MNENLYAGFFFAWRIDFYKSGSSVTFMVDAETEIDIQPF